MSIFHGRGPTVFSVSIQWPVDSELKPLRLIVVSRFSNMLGMPSTTMDTKLKEK